jgi:hypothetical protein
MGIADAVVTPQSAAPATKLIVRAFTGTSLLLDVIKSDGPILSQLCKAQNCSGSLPGVDIKSRG